MQQKGDRDRDKRLVVVFLLELMIRPYFHPSSGWTRVPPIARGIVWYLGTANLSRQTKTYYHGPTLHHIGLDLQSQILYNEQKAFLSACVYYSIRIEEFASLAEPLDLIDSQKGTVFHQDMEQLQW